MTAAPEPTVHAAGTRRRVQALAVAGWPMHRLARETGLAGSSIAWLMNAPNVPVSRARIVAALYARLSLANPVLCGVAPAIARAARDRAVAAGWAPASAWDDDTIDDPSALAEWTGYCGKARGVDLHHRHGIPLCPPCQDALYRRHLRNAAHELRATSTTRT
ncbi:hypothetical protein DMH25_08295 [Streptomyces sp. WAC 01325]|uniref:hypothetical protein n=1 Tax=Streptomyces sp. WAC 01325 TaxID=2203202 RepID=UPI000F860EF6|nr:hypothetical protein [Streptomyces sp. WAC 01325]RSN13778.1 hypothetical protein DMH25_08295 [Streptomyces sp. WAC 01325]